VTAMPDWAALLFGAGAGDAWPQIFAAVADAAATAPDVKALEQALGDGDRLLDEAAWDLWRTYADAAPRALTSLGDWWRQAAPVGRAVLVLDSLSVRELWRILRAGTERGVTPTTVTVQGAPVPTDTEAAAHLLGLSQRSQLQFGKYPPSFVFAADRPETDVTNEEFGVLADRLPPARDIVIWHSWLDDLLHQLADKAQGATQIQSVAATVLKGDGFWRLVDNLRQGRRLLVTSDHGYAVSRYFSDLPDPLAGQARAAFKAQRCGPLPAVLFSRLGAQPLYVGSGNRAAVVGPWKWNVEGGFPHLSHGGLTLAEVCVPYLEFAPL